MRKQSKTNTSARVNRKTQSKSKYKPSKEAHIKDNGAYFDNEYRKGSFNSMKNQTIMTYRSSYEYEYMKKLEADSRCLKYISEPFMIPYVDADGAKKNYIPDLLVLWDTGKIELLEIKPSAMIRASNVQRKAKWAIRWLKEKSPDITFRFITEKDIFKSNKHYKDVLESLSTKKASKPRGRPRKVD